MLLLVGTLITWLFHDHQAVVLRIESILSAGFEPVT